MRTSAVTAISIVALLAGCAPTQMPMTYSPTTAIQSVAAVRPAAVQVDRVVNERTTGREDPTWIGTIRGGYGNPLKALHAPAPVDKVVAKAFSDALAARGFSAPAGDVGRYTLTVTIHDLDANQYVRREATADFSAVLTDRATGREVWRDREKAYTVDGSIVSLNAGILGSVDDLHRVAVQTMNQAIDRLLNKPGFLTAVRS